MRARAALCAAARRRSRALHPFPGPHGRTSPSPASKHSRSESPAAPGRRGIRYIPYQYDLHGHRVPKKPPSREPPPPAVQYYEDSESVASSEPVLAEASGGAAAGGVCVSPTVGSSPSPSPNANQQKTNISKYENFSYHYHRKPLLYFYHFFLSFFDLKKLEKIIPSLEILTATLTAKLSFTRIILHRTPLSPSSCSPSAVARACPCLCLRPRECAVRCCVRDGAKDATLVPSEGVPRAHTCPCRTEPPKLILCVAGWTERRAPTPPSQSTALAPGWSCWCCQHRPRRHWSSWASASASAAWRVPSCEAWKVMGTRRDALPRSTGPSRPSSPPLAPLLGPAAYHRWPSGARAKCGCVHGRRACGLR